MLYVALPCFFLIRMWYNYTTSLGKWILQAPSSWFVHIRSVFNWSMARLWWVFCSISFGGFVYRIFLGLNGADYSNLIELALYGSSHTMDAFRYLSIIQNKRRNKGMTEEDAERMQAMYQFRY